VPYQPPAQLGVQAIDVDLAELVDYIDWGPFFQTWDLAGRFPEDPRRRGRRRDRPRALPMPRSDARPAWSPSRTPTLAQAKAVFGLFPANAVGDDIEIYADEARAASADELARPASAA
jgi:5-methyltetrahydrofolate--homocysteine methyltransferase